MRQVPLKTPKDTSYLKAFSCYGLVGSGKLAKHFAHYLKLLNLPFKTWSRRNKTFINKALKDCSHVLILIKDSEIHPFLQNHQSLLHNKICLHCSGAIFTPLAIGVHPLMTFSQKLYDLKVYKQMHFVMDHPSPFRTILPGLPNSHSIIDPAQKAKYHALCVIAGHFSSLLWQIFFHQMTKHFGISKSQALVYFNQVFANISHLDHHFTGPLQRKDYQTVKLNLQALKNEPLLYETYQTFIKLNSVENFQGEV